MYNNNYSYGKNTIIYNLGDGNDTINIRGANSDTLQFGEGITLENTIFKGSGNDLIIQFKDFEGSIRVTEDLSNEQKRIDSFKFADGTVLNHSEMLEIKNTQAQATSLSMQAMTFQEDTNNSSDPSLSITDSDINKIIQDMTAYKTAEDAAISYSDNINTEKELLTLVNSGM